MKLYQCHKQVRAAKIIHVTTILITDPADSEAVKAHRILQLAGVEKPFMITPDWYEKHKPDVGGYYVEYEDGYTSYSPAEAFESGYTLIESIPEEITRPFGTCAITGPREDVAFILKHLPDVDDK